jgi:hypothetical protein
MDGWIHIPMMKYAEEEQVLCQLASTLYRLAELHQGRSISRHITWIYVIVERHYFLLRKPCHMSVSNNTVLTPFEHHSKSTYICVFFLLIDRYKNYIFFMDHPVYQATSYKLKAYYCYNSAFAVRRSKVAIQNFVTFSSNTPWATPTKY